jgi:hypothetical protein
VGSDEGSDEDHREAGAEQPAADAEEVSQEQAAGSGIEIEDDGGPSAAEPEEGAEKPSDVVELPVAR